MGQTTLTKRVGSKENSLMNSPENYTPEKEPKPRSSADYFIEYCASNAPTRRLSRTIRSLYEEHGPAFAAYLSLEDIDAASDSLADDYENAYVGTYLDEDALIENELSSLGWVEAVDAVIREQTIPEGVLEWNHDALLEHLRRYLYDLIDLDGFLYAFAK